MRRIVPVHRQFPHPSQRRGGVGTVIAIVLGSVALALATFATVWAVFVRTGPKETTGTEGLPGKGLSAYEFTTAEGAMLSELKIERNTDLKAQLELNRQRRGKALQEQIDTMKVEKWRDYDRSKRKKQPYDPPDDEDFDSTVKILFVSYERGGKKRHIVRYYQRHKETGFWQSTFVSGYSMPPEMKDVQKEIRDWEARDRSTERPRIEKPPIEKPRIK